MTTHTYRYQNPDRSIYFRGYVQWYEGRKQLRVSAPLARSTKGEAERDAKAMRTMAEKRGVQALLLPRRLMKQ